METNLDTAIMATGVILALVQLIKNSWPNLPLRYLPLVTFGAGLAWTLLDAWSIDPETIKFGIIQGLSVSGLYEMGKALKNPLAGQTSGPWTKIGQ